MTRLIDADTLDREYQERYKLFTWDDGGREKATLARVVQILHEQPTIDAVTVVRCKDCIWSRRGVSGDLFCFYTGLVKEYYFCSYGEKNNGNKKDECLGCYWSGYDRENAVIRKPCDDCSETNLRTEG